MSSQSKIPVSVVIITKDEERAIERCVKSVGHYDLKPLTHHFDRHNRYSDWEAVLRQDDVNNGVLVRANSVVRPVPGRSAS